MVAVVALGLTALSGCGSDAVPIDVPPVNEPPAGLPTISGTATENTELTGSGATITDANGLGTFSYQWLRDGNAIAGMTSTKYTLGDDDVGAVIQFRVTYTDGDGTTETLTSAATTAVANVNDAPVGLPTISGAATEDATLTASTAAVTDPDGLGGGGFTYQWLRGGSAIGGATATTYTLGDDDVGAVIAVRVTYTDGHGTAETPTSAATTAVANVNDTPVGLPTITGTATEDSVLTASATSIADVDGLGTFSYQWLRAGNVISGASSTTYTLDDADVGAVVSVRVTYADGHGTTETPTSAATSAVANVNDAPVGVPTISGPAMEDSVLTASATSIADADGLGTLAYDWLRDGNVISGATSTTYTLGDADVGAVISVRVIYADGHGTTEAPTSVGTAVVGNVNDAPVGVPAISGPATEDSILTASAAAITDLDGLGTFGYQWLRDGNVIAGATSTTYTLGDDDVGAVISVRTTYTDGYGTTETPTSVATIAVANVNDTPVGLPTITGTTSPDQTLTASTSGISDADGLGAFSYQWLRGSTSISSATSSTYVLGEADVGSTISVRVTYTDAKSTAESLTSAATDVVTGAGTWDGISDLIVTGPKNHTCRIKYGRLYCWGYNQYGQLGIGTNANSTVPVQVGTAADWIQVSASGGDSTGHTCGIRAVVTGATTENRLYCWGSNGTGQLGDSSTTQSATPVPVGTVGDTGWTNVSAGTDHSCGIRSGMLYCWGSNAGNRLGDGTTTQSTVPVRIGTDAADWDQVAAGRFFSCAGRSGGKLYCWGTDGTGKFGEGASAATVHSTPWRIGTNADWDQIAVSHNGYACGIRNGELYCWGNNGNSQLGNGSTTSATVLTQVGTVGVGIWSDWKQVAVSSNNTTCGIRSPVVGGVTQDLLYCWGYNGSGQLGDGTTTQRNAPLQVGSATNWDQVAVGDAHVCAVRSTVVGGVTNDNVYCWGGNGSGQLGKGSVLASSGSALSPLRVGTDSDWTHVASGSNYGCGIKAGDLYCWGSNSSGQLGIGNTTASTTRKLVTVAGTPAGTVSEWTAVSIGGSYTCGIRQEVLNNVTSQNLYCWGSNSAGQLGDGSTSQSTSPVRVTGGELGVGDWTNISAGQTTTCGIRQEVVNSVTSKNLYCWGSNSFGQLGINKNSNVASGGVASSSTPMRVANVMLAGASALSAETNWNHVTAGATQNCAISGDRLFCWGNGGQGQNGNGTTSQKNVPTQVGTSAAGTLSNWTYAVVPSNASAGSTTCGIRSPSSTSTDSNILYCWGKNDASQLANGNLVNQPSPVRIGATDTGWSHVAVASSHVCAVRSGALYCWGSNTATPAATVGQLGDGTTSPSASPVRVGGDVAWSRVSAGINHSCGLRNGSLSCWGSNVDGRLGIEVTTAIGGPAVDLLIGGTVTGIPAGESLVIANNNGTSYEITQNGDYTFPSSMIVGSDYSVTVVSAPSGHSCTVQRGYGTLLAGDVLDIDIVCVGP